jgi:tripartite-type tricarboxylate transporter receptor subunit TctC
MRSATAVGLALCFSVSVAVIAPAQAQLYPDRPVKIVVPFPAGGTADAVPRLLGDFLSRKWGQAVLIENHSGAGGNVGAEFVYRAVPDGYTLLSSPPPPLVTNHNLYSKLNFDPLQFEPVSVMAHVPTGLFVNPDKIKANSVPELIEYLRQTPDKVTAATQGNGTTSHLTSEMFQLMAKVKLRNIPYRGSAPALQGLLAGDVDLMFDNLGVSMAMVNSGKLKLLAVASPQRLAYLPNVPAMTEILPGFESAAWYAIVAPPKTPRAIVDKINADVSEALKQPDIQSKLKNLSAEVYGGSPERAAKYMGEEVVRWGGVIKAANIKIEQ